MSMASLLHEKDASLDFLGHIMLPAACRISQVGPMHSFTQLMYFHLSPVMTWAHKSAGFQGTQTLYDIKRWFPHVTVTAPRSIIFLISRNCSPSYIAPLSPILFLFVNLLAMSVATSSP
ncbi:hypothetical protein BS50DRAFT_358300 [Corynespora cassiicola Philippines]|uniref:Uncharacterized protein n=1 Tax=Corynespora cassiicola Philippines TaxID=1448308 RepID=A0A2T2NS06_CORCC|nr:hypothetical protein BS50DRAFT_358300 [Corynespora cassiicola Philippines]